MEHLRRGATGNIRLNAHSGNCLPNPRPRATKAWAKPRRTAAGGRARVFGGSAKNSESGEIALHGCIVTAAARVPAPRGADQGETGLGRLRLLRIEGVVLPRPIAARWRTHVPPQLQAAQRMRRHDGRSSGFLGLRSYARLRVAAGCSVGAG